MMYQRLKEEKVLLHSYKIVNKRYTKLTTKLNQYTADIEIILKSNQVRMFLTLTIL